MATYRDDFTDVAIAKDGLAFRLITLASDIVNVQDVGNAKMTDRAIDTLAITADTTDKFTAIGADVLMAADDIVGRQHVKSVLHDGVIITDVAYRKYRDSFSDDLQASDTKNSRNKAVFYGKDKAIVADGNQYKLIELVADKVNALDRMLSDKRLAELVNDRLHIGDKITYKSRTAITDELLGKDSLSTKARLTGVLSSDFGVSDDVLDVIKRQSHVADTAKVADGVVDRLIARNDVADQAFIDDTVLADGSGIIWTANTVNFAMSQYTPQDINRLAVIDGVLYAECKDGVYRLDGSNELIQATMTTGKVDFGVNLVKPSYAYTEYASDGELSMTVQTTQKGVPQAYDYHLPKEVADELTNGRFVFGRGLYGRHFSFTLNIKAKQGIVHDLFILFEPTKRRL